MNQIESLKGANFTTLDNLTNLFLTVNQIDTMDWFKNALSGLKINNILTIYMYGNPVTGSAEYDMVTAEIKGGENTNIEFKPFLSSSIKE